MRVGWITPVLARVATGDAAVAETYGLSQELNRWVGTVPADELHQVRGDFTEWARDPNTGAWR